jgi:hypothetical protein
MRRSFGILRVLKSAPLLVFSALLLAGCQTFDNPYAYSYSNRSDKELCLVRNPANSEAAVLQLKEALREKGFAVREVRAAAFCDSCIRFRSAGSSQMQIERAELTLEEAGSVKHRVHWEKPDGSQLDVQDSEQMIRDLVDRMFPEPTPWETR